MQPQNPTPEGDLWWEHEGGHKVVAMGSSRCLGTLVARGGDSRERPSGLMGWAQGNRRDSTNIPLPSPGPREGSLLNSVCASAMQGLGGKKWKQEAENSRAARLLSVL